EETRVVFDNYLVSANKSYNEFKTQPVLSEKENLAALEEKFNAFVVTLNALKGNLDNNDVAAYINLPAQQNQDELISVINNYLSVLNDESNASIADARFYNQFAWGSFFTVIIIIFGVIAVVHLWLKRKVISPLNSMS